MSQSHSQTQIKERHRKCKQKHCEVVKERTRQKWAKQGKNKRKNEAIPRKEQAWQNSRKNTTTAQWEEQVILKLEYNIVPSLDEVVAWCFCSLGACGRLHKGLVVAYTKGMRLPTHTVCGCLHAGYVVVYTQGMWLPTRRVCACLHIGYVVVYPQGMRLPTRWVCGCLHIGYVVAYT